MAYDEDLAWRIRELVSQESGLTEQRMFGGLAFLVHGNMAVSASGQGGILVRVDPADNDQLIADARAEAAVMGGRTMQGWLRVAADLLETQRELETWVRRGVEYARSLPPKQHGRSRR
jgi:TfoX/Sxy family transcriptional regulator of competence genes